MDGDDGSQEDIDLPGLPLASALVGDAETLALVGCDGGALLQPQTSVSYEE